MSWLTPWLVGLPVETVRRVRRSDGDAISTRRKGHTISGTLGHRPLATTTTDPDTVDNVSLLGLVSKTTGLVRARRAGSTVDNIELTVLNDDDALSANVQRVTSRAGKQTTGMRTVGPDGLDRESLRVKSRSRTIKAP